MNTSAGRVAIVMIGYLAVTAFILMLPAQSSLPSAGEFPAVARGVRVWQASRCYTCHSLYGLGGHIGPDLTNIHSLRGPDYVRAFLISGRPGMPSYAHLPAADMDALLAYLAYIDGTAEYPMKGGRVSPFGRLKEAAP